MTAERCPRDVPVMAQNPTIPGNPCTSRGSGILQANVRGCAVEPFPLNHAGRFCRLTPPNRVLVRAR